MIRSKLSAIGLLFFLAGCREEAPSLPRESVPPPVPASVQLVSGRRQQITEALTLAVGSDAEGLELLAFSRARGSYVTVSDRGRFLVDGRPEADMAITQNGVAYDHFFIDVSSADRRQRFGLDAVASFQYSARRNVLFSPPPETFTQLWFGILAAHELLHARDHQMGIEPDMTQELLDPAYMLGEARAHSLEIRLLDAATHGEFVRRLNRILDEHLPPAAVNDMRAYVPPVAVRRLLPGIDSLFPPSVGEIEHGNRLGSYTIALNFLFADRQTSPASALERRARLYENVTRGQPFEVLPPP